MTDNSNEEGKWLLVGTPYDAPPNDAETTSSDDSRIEDVDAIQTVIDDAISSGRRTSYRITGDERELVEDRVYDIPWYDGNDEYIEGAYVTHNSAVIALFLEVEE